jgi:hypothetical protein
MLTWRLQRDGEVGWRREQQAQGCCRHAWGEGREGGRRHQVLLRRSPCRSCRHPAAVRATVWAPLLSPLLGRPVPGAPRAWTAATTRSPTSMAGSRARAHPLVSRRRVGAAMRIHGSGEGRKGSRRMDCAGGEIDLTQGEEASGRGGWEAAYWGIVWQG